jgi:hypothetical protein
VAIFPVRMLHLILRRKDSAEDRRTSRERRRIARHETRVALCKTMGPIFVFIATAFVSAAILVEVEGPEEQKRLAAKEKEHSYLEMTRTDRLFGLYDALGCPYGAPYDPNGIRVERSQPVNQTAAAALLIEAQMNASALYEEMTYLIERYVRHNANADRNWTFIGALYFVFTVVTTIGCACSRGCSKAYSNQQDELCHALLCVACASRWHRWNLRAEHRRRQGPHRRHRHRRRWHLCQHAHRPQGPLYWSPRPCVQPDLRGGS